MGTGNNPYAPPDPYSGYDPPIEEGSYGLGIALGFILGLWGLIGCLIAAKPLTKKGAKHGFLYRIGASLVLVLLFVAADSM